MWILNIGVPINMLGIVGIVCIHVHSIEPIVIDARVTIPNPSIINLRIAL